MRNAFRNRAVNLLNIHYGFQNFANNLVSVFVGVYLFQRGVPLPALFLAWASIALVRIPLRYIGVLVCSALGLRKSLILGTVFFPTFYFCLNQVTGVDIWLVATVIAGWMTDILYWLPYHTYFSVLGDEEHRGKQVGVKEGIGLLTAFLAPVCGSFLVGVQGFSSLFLSSALIMLFSTVPLLFTPETPFQERSSLSEALKKVDRSGFWLCTGWGIHQNSMDFTWKLVLFLVLGNYLSFGGFVSLAVFLQAVGGYISGHFFDTGKGRKWYPLGFLLLILVILGRAFFADNIPTILFLDILGTMAYLLVFPPLSSAYYNAGKKDHHPLWFYVFTETGFDVGGGLSAFFVAGILFLGGKLQTTMVLGAAGVFLMWQFLFRYYQRNSKEH